MSENQNVLLTSNKGTGSIEETRMLTANGSKNFVLSQAMSDELQGFQRLDTGISAEIVTGVIPLAVTSIVGITLKCNTTVTLYAKLKGTDIQRDYPGGDGAADIQKTAIKNAEETAKSNVKADLERQAGLILCPTGCSKTVGIISTQIATKGSITGSDFGSLWDTYTASAEAEGSVTVQC